MNELISGDSSNNSDKKGSYCPGCQFVSKGVNAHRDILTMRILVRPSLEKYTELKLEITSETDIFKTYICEIDIKRFERYRKGQSLNFSFNQFLTMLVKQLNLCYKSPEQYSALLHLNGNSSFPKFELTENIEYKSIELMALDFEELDEETNRAYISYRFSYMKAKNERVQTKIREVYNILKLKNPNLLNSILKKNHLLQGFQEKWINQ